MLIIKYCKLTPCSSRRPQPLEDVVHRLWELLSNLSGGGQKIRFKISLHHTHESKLVYNRNHYLEKRNSFFSPYCKGVAARASRWQQVMGHGGRKGKLVPSRFTTLLFVSEKKTEMFKNVRSNIWKEQFKKRVNYYFRLFIDVRGQTR